MFGEMGADGHEYGIETVLRPGRHDVFDLAVQADLHTDAFNLADFRIQHIAWHAIGGYAKAHHATRHGAGLADFHFVSHQGQVPCGRQAGRSCTDHQNFLATGGCFDFRQPASFQGKVTQEPLDRMNAHRVVDVLAVTGRFAGVITHPSVNGRHRIVSHQYFPRLLEIAGLRPVQPGLDVLTCGTGVTAGWDRIQEYRFLVPYGTGTGFLPQIGR